MGQQTSGDIAAVVRPLVGRSAWIRQIQAKVAAVAPYSSSALIVGPSGTGKELIARLLHAKSPRCDGPFIPVNCAAISGTLFESHMFGHAKGAFTGANYAARGCFRAADGGTILLDEIGELDPSMQAKLLRVLQEGRVVTVGSHEEEPIDVRVVAATNRDLTDDVAQGRFREDLYYRLAVVTLRTLPLRARLEDVELLADYLLSSQCVKHGLPFKPLTPGALEKLRSHPWPGNVRELQNVLERAVMLSRGALIDDMAIQFDGQEPERAAVDGRIDDGHCPRALPNESVVDSQWHFPRAVDGRWPTFEECERQIIEATLEQTCHNQAAAARLLGLDRGVLRRRIKRLGIDVSGSKPGRPRSVRDGI